MTTNEYRFNLEATLRTCCGFSKQEFECLTWCEAEKFVKFYRKEQSNTFKLFAYRNLESTRIAQHGKKNDCEKYIRDLSKEEEHQQDNNLDDQFDREFR